MSLDRIKASVEKSKHPRKLAFWLVRHAESDNNIFGEKSPVMHDTPLTEHGIEQGKTIAKYLLDKAVRVSHVYSSDSMRGKGTAKPIAEAFGVPVVVKPGLNERDWGELKDLPWIEVAEKLKGLSTDERFTFVPKDGESWQQMEERLLKVLEEIAEEADDGEDIVIVTHRGDLRALLPLLAKAGRDKHEDYSVELGSLSRFSFDRDEFDFINLKLNEQ